ncbi:heavy metal translocating P-type ATPase [Falsiroseomonas selenitidurans]|uniref:Heavy metal translocating P-type ATPase n=1 Tax=Falsiroseomonas selenitidurans TaxID=2716335 RepID=A0ABX1DX86_9PROT|nr:heavy metal translocating P-type ATPase [Falsiroseomonas selenitidurans]NKC29539.1 heavy metal translocating P-type ATPase [Falsiroseomonas selenitidurans]
MTSQAAAPARFVPEPVGLSRAECAHCGAGLAPGQGAFCCHGCAGAHALVRGLGLDAFYRRRDMAAGTLRPPESPPAFDAESLAVALPDGTHRLELMLSGLSCGACVWLVEQALAAESDVLRARASLSARRLTIVWRGPAARGRDLAALVARLGFRVAPWSPACLRAAEDAEGQALVRALGIAAFGAMNVMLVSVAVWVGGDMGEQTRALMHWLAALIGLPTVLVAGMPFYRSAWQAVRAGRANMDLAVSLGVVATTAMSLSEAFRNGPYTWFDGATALLALLLAGRVLDRGMRRRARQAVAELLALQEGSVALLCADGTTRAVPAESVQAGDRILLAAGERLRLDGRSAEPVVLDLSATTGESVPRHLPAGEVLPAGAVNMGPAFTLQVTAALRDGSLAALGRLLERAEQGKGRFVSIADRAARLYVPVVHAVAVATFLGWWLGVGVEWQVALVPAVAALIVTCPCGLAIAVPAVQVAAVGALFRRGVLVASSTALERLASADHVVLDKTGTLSEGHPELVPNPLRDPALLRQAAGMARGSRHPLAQALLRACPDAPVEDGVEEVAGYGLRKGALRLGSAVFCEVAEPLDSGMSLYLARPGEAPVAFHFTDRLRADAAAVVAGLQALGLETELLSGDAPGSVEAAALATRIGPWQARATPADKAARVEALRAAGSRPLMVGDGINDAAALALAHVSASPANGTDIAQATSDIVLRGDGLSALPYAITVARRAQRLARQNIAFSLAYNIVAVPAAVLGLVTPLIAAVVMASSSIIVILNALRAGKEAAS